VFKKELQALRGIAKQSQSTYCDMADEGPEQWS
jgi:hypothetical protein